MITKKCTNSFHPFRSEKAKLEYHKFNQDRAMKWPISYEEKMYQTSFGDTYVRICGPLNGEPLILMHGGGDNSSSWAPNIESFAKGYRVYAVDLINGTNMSVCTKPIRNIEDIMIWMNELFDSIGIKVSINIVGMSYGAYLTARYILSNPTRVKKAVLIAPPNYAIPNSCEFILRVLLSILPLRCFTSSMFYWMFKDLVRIKGDNGKQITEMYIDRALLIRKCYTLQKFVNPIVFSKEELLKISVPTYFMIGENDINYSAKKAIKFLNEVATNIQTELFKDAGHDLPILLAPIINEKILNFLKSK